MYFLMLYIHSIIGVVLYGSLLASNIYWKYFSKILKNSRIRTFSKVGSMFPTGTQKVKVLRENHSKSRICIISESRFQWIWKSLSVWGAMHTLPAFWSIKGYTWENQTTEYQTAILPINRSDSSLNILYISTKTNVSFPRF